MVNAIAIFNIIIDILIIICVIIMVYLVCLYIIFLKDFDKFYHKKEFEYKYIPNKELLDLSPEEKTKYFDHCEECNDYHQFVDIIMEKYGSDLFYLFKRNKVKKEIEFYNKQK